MPPPSKSPIGQSARSADQLDCLIAGDHCNQRPKRRNRRRQILPAQGELSATIRANSQNSPISVQMLLTPLQNINPKNRSRLKQRAQVWCLLTYMEMKPKRTPLKIEFKQFQRLPEWPIVIRSTEAGRSIERTSLRKVGMASVAIEQDRSGARCFAE
jgi:hypothetical protein